jgi:hypothetical protein
MDDTDLDDFLLPNISRGIREMALNSENDELSD